MTDRAPDAPGWTDAQIKTLREVAARAFAPLQVAEPLSLIEWADKHFWLSEESSDIPGRWSTVHFQKGMLWCMQSEEIERLDIQKCARIGYTKCLLIDIGYHATHTRRQMVLYQPTDDDAKEFAKDSIETMLRDTKAVGSQLKFGDVKNKHNTLSVKQFHGVNLHILGGKAARAYRRITKDRVYYDELDGFDRDIDGEGAPVQLGDKRCQNSPHKKSIRGTTPRVAGESNIEDCVAKADEVFTYHPRCYHCDERVPFQFRHLHFTDRDATTVMGVCDNCGALWDHSRHFDLMEAGAWISENGVEIDNDTGVFTRHGGRVPTPRHVALKPWAAISPWVTWRTIIEEHLASLDNPLDRKVFTNTVLGELWVDEVGDSVAEEDVMERAETYAAACPIAVNYITAAVDVQADRLELLYVGWSDGEIAWSLKHEILNGDPSQPGDIWDRLDDELRERTFERSDGARIEVGLCGVDSGYLTDLVYAFCRRDAGRYIPIKGQDSGPIQQFQKRRSRNLRVHLTPVGTDQAKTLVYARLKAPGAMHFPRNPDHDAEYFKQLTCEERRKKYTAGHIKHYWWKPAHARNEILDLHVYNVAMVRIAMQHYGVRLEQSPLTNRAAPEPQKPDNASDWIPDVDDWLPGTTS